MQAEWLKKKGNGTLVLFFNGWGMEPWVVGHLKGEEDILAFSDYRTLEIEEEVLRGVDNYARVYVVAWSMGVWAAANVLRNWALPLRGTVALNGTERPVDDTVGIPEKVYLLTERGMNPRGRERFVARMLGDAEEKERFKAHPLCRELPELCEELVKIREQCAVARQVWIWDKVYISRQDVIFPPDNQQHWWDGRAKEIRFLPGAHYPFYHFQSWEEILS